MPMCGAPTRATCCIFGIGIFGNWMQVEKCVYGVFFW